MTRYAHQTSYESFGFSESPVALAIDAELYQAGRAWGMAGNTKVPKYYQLDRGDGHVTNIAIVGSIGVSASEFVRGWKETKPMSTTTKSKKR